jgi:hypothetical protein
MEYMTRELIYSKILELHGQRRLRQGYTFTKVTELFVDVASPCSRFRAFRHKL